MIADQNAWEYFDSSGVEIYAEQSEFDGKHGIMAYNKTIQKSGKSNQMRDMDEWIVAVGKHKGLIAGADWVKVQDMLNQNRSKSYRKPKRQCGVALRSAVLWELWQLYASQAQPEDKRTGREDLQLSL